MPKFQIILFCFVSALCGSARSYASVNHATAIKTDSASTSIKIAETLSPNGDGIADHWDIGQLANLPDVVVNVYNRYGTQVYFSVGYSKPWDGTNRGRILPAGSYYYVIESKSAAKRINGKVKLVRQ